MAENLKAGRFTLVVAVDRITDELKIVVPYINGHTVDEVRFLALEIGYIKDRDVEIVLPSVYGEESADEKQRQRRNTWSVDAYFENFTNMSDQSRTRSTHSWNFRRNAVRSWPRVREQDPSLNVRFRFHGVQKTVWSSYYYASGPTFDLNFEYLRDLVSAEALRESAQILRSLDGASERYARLDGDFKARPSLPIEGCSPSPARYKLAQQALATILNGAIIT